MNGAAIRPILVAMVAAVLTVAGACAPRTVSTVPDAADDTALDARLLRMLDTRTVDTALIDEVLRSPRSISAHVERWPSDRSDARPICGAAPLLIDAGTAVAANAALRWASKGFRGVCTGPRRSRCIKNAREAHGHWEKSVNRRAVIVIALGKDSLSH
jgi:hypothetical protein